MVTLQAEFLRRLSPKPDQATVKSMQREIDKAKESERKMLESVIDQTKQLEKAKSDLEEATATWQAKEQSFISCMKESEEEINRLKEEGERLRRENMGLKEVVAARESSLRAMKLDLECVKLQKFEALEKIEALEKVEKRFSSERWSVSERTISETEFGLDEKVKERKKKNQILRRFGELIGRSRRVK